ncbi:lipid asymmetry maintenance protein MlaB [Uliginosibacterium paludis]|jgi:anti-anti-sigma factor|uniref:STAS domain-containing protein n=1 Tax=Uliginosibacterium paludis TaxID=1615952 RepID=A0ABV2CRG1_9RHOO
MNCFTLVNDESDRVLLAGELTIYAAAELKPRLLDQLHRREALEIDLAGVSELDCAGVQVMLMLQNEARLLGRKLSWSGHSEVVRQQLGTLNLGHAFDAPAALVWS